MKCDNCKHSGQLPDDIFPKRIIKCCEKGHWCEGSSNPPGDPKRWENCPDYQDTTEYINMLYNLPFGISRQDARERLGLNNEQPKLKKEPMRSGKTWIEPSRELIGWWGKVEPDEPQPEFLQDAVNLSIELSAATRETETLKTFLKELHLLTAFQDWKAEQDEKENEP